MVARPFLFVHVSVHFYFRCPTAWTSHMSAAAADGGSGSADSPQKRRKTVKPLSKKRLEKHLAAAENRGAPLSTLGGARTHSARRHRRPR